MILNEEHWWLHQYLRDHPDQQQEEERGENEMAEREIQVSEITQSGIQFSNDKKQRLILRTEVVQKLCPHRQKIQVKEWVLD